MKKLFFRKNPLFFFKAKNTFFLNLSKEITEEKIKSLKNFTYNKDYLNSENSSHYFNNFNEMIYNSYGITSKSQKIDSIFSWNLFFKFFQKFQFDNFLQIYFKLLNSLVKQEKNFFLENCEPKLSNKILDFFEKLNYSDLNLKLFTPEKEKTQINLIQNKVFKGVFIERNLNYNTADYSIKDSNKKAKYSLIRPEEKSFIKDCKFNCDEGVDSENFELLRNSQRINQFLFEIQTNVRINYYNSKGELIYGDEKNSDIYETHYIVIENQREYMLKTKDFITDFDFILKKNPHTSL